MTALKTQWFIDLLFDEIKGYIEYQDQKERGAYMKTKQQILEAIKQCQRMTLKPEQDCCSKCPYKHKKHCYGALLTDLLFSVDNFILNDENREPNKQVLGDLEEFDDEKIY